MIVALVDIEGAHGMHICVNILGAELKLVIEESNAQKSTKISQTINNASIPSQ